MLNCGIYTITCTETGKVYVGSSINIIKRKNRHFSDLKHNRHYNRYLQNAWNKYGEDNFIFEILEICDTDNLLTCELNWINRYDSTDLTSGYNLCLETRRPHLNINYFEKTHKVVDPDGNVLEFTGVKKFALANNLNSSKLSQLALGKLNHYKGYRPYNEEYLNIPFNPSAYKYGKRLMKTYKLKNPDGEVVEFTGLAAHCRKHNLSSGTLASVISGNRKSHKGWRAL